MDPTQAQQLLAPLFPPASDEEARKLLALMLREGSIDRLGAALEQQPQEPAAPALRDRYLLLLEATADEVSTYEQAARLWRRIAQLRARSQPSEAFLALARAFAYVPEDTSMLPSVRALAATEGKQQAEEATRWLHGLVRDGILARAALHEFENALDPPQRSDGARALAEQVAQCGTEEEARTLLQRIEQEERTGELFSVLRGETGTFPPTSPQEARLLLVLRVLETRLPPSRARGEVRYLLALRSEWNGDPQNALRNLCLALNEFDAEPCLALAEEWFRNDPDAYNAELLRRMSRNAALTPERTQQLQTLFRTVTT